MDRKQFIINIITMKWIGEIRTDLKLAGISPHEVQNRKTFRKEIQKSRVDHEEKPKLKTGTIWSMRKPRFNVLCVVIMGLLANNNNNHYTLLSRIRFIYKF